MRSFILGLCSILFASTSSPAKASSPCEIMGSSDGNKIEKASYQLFFQTDPKNITVGKFFTLKVHICPTDGSPLPDGLKIDAMMPMHGHGMNYRPTVKQTAPGIFQAKGLMMHMAGSWMLRFDIRRGDRSTRVQTKLILK